MGNILAIVLSRLGDLVQCYPAFSDLSRLSGESGVTVLVQKDLEKVARMHPCVKDTIPFDGDLLMPLLRQETNWSTDPLNYLGDVFKQIEALHPELVINLTHTGFSGRLCGLIPRTEVRGRTFYQNVGSAFCGEWTRYFFTLLTSRSCNAFNLVDIHRMIAGGLPGWPDRPVYDDKAHQFALGCLHNLHGQNVIALGIGAQHPLRRWPLERWLYTARLLRERCDAGLIIVGSASEKAQGDQIQADLDDHCLNICGQTDPMQLAAVLDQCDLFIGHDSGPLHLAAAMNTRALGIYLAMASAWETGPYLDGSVTLEPNLSCHPCSEKGNCADPICQKKIQPEVVADAAIRLLYGEHPGDYQDCVVRTSAWDEDGYIMLSGEHKPSDDFRLAWRKLLPLMLSMENPFWDEVTLSAHNTTVLPVMQNSISELKDAIVQLMQQSIFDYEQAKSAGEEGKGSLFDLELPGMIARFPEYRPLFDLYRLDKLPGEDAHFRATLRNEIIAQDKLMRRISIIQEFCGDREKLYFPIGSRFKLQDTAPLAPLI
ncbi:MAG: glycosyltransferase family 9 protein [bacterium]|nr:glycosyltransferase family 9 protein [bacterium]